MLFNDDIRVQPTENGCTAQISNNWSINGVPNGGYLMAVITQALKLQSEREAPVLITANYLGRTEPGEVSVTAEMMAQSKQFDRMQVSLMQHGKERIRAMATFMDSYQTEEVHYDDPAPDLLPRAECQAMMGFPKYTLFRNVDMLLEPESMNWMKGRQSPRSEHRGWLRLQEGNEWDPMSLMLAADAFPPPVFATQGANAWVPTIELSVQLRQLPKTEWLKCVFRSRFITGSLLEEDGELWDEEGNLVAISRQLAQFKKTETSTGQKMGMKAAGALLTARNSLSRKKYE